MVLCSGVFVSAVFLVATIVPSKQDPDSRRLLHMVLDVYNTLERPVAKNKDPLFLNLGFRLVDVLSVDEGNGILATSGVLEMEWMDVNLQWDSAEFGDVKKIYIPSHRMWKPDLLLVNSADEGFDGTFATNVQVDQRGLCKYIPPGVFKTTCNLRNSWYVFEGAKCDLVFKSWMIPNLQMSLVLKEDLAPAPQISRNLGWKVESISGRKEVRDTQDEEGNATQDDVIVFTIALKRQGNSCFMGSFIVTFGFTFMTLWMLNCGKGYSSTKILVSTILFACYTFWMSLTHGRDILGSVASMYAYVSWLLIAGMVGVSIGYSTLWTDEASLDKFPRKHTAWIRGMFLFIVALTAIGTLLLAYMPVNM